MDPSCLTGPKPNGKSTKVPIRPLLVAGQGTGIHLHGSGRADCRGEEYAGGCRSKSLECPGRWKLRRGTRRSTLMGLLAATGIWVGEVIRLGRDDIDWARGGLAIHEWKCAPSRWVPVLKSALTALDCYARVRDQFCSRHHHASLSRWLSPDEPPDHPPHLPMALRRRKR